MSRKLITRHRVKELAQERGWSMSSLAYQVGISPMIVRNMFQDPHYDGMYSTWSRLAKAFEIPISELVFEDPLLAEEQRREEGQDHAENVPLPAVRRRAGARKNNQLSLISSNRSST